ncbi:hypothetical protein AD930_12615 [Acetobacter malorum]|nr:hypothetical protein AD930_12615 [Acetobacter malorum]
MLIFICFSSGIISKAKAQSISFSQGIEAAWSIDPGRTELNTNYRSATARADAAGSWFAGGPTVSGQYFDDHAIGSNEGYTTYEGSVSVPLWLPGQGSATSKVARAEALTVQQKLHVERMVVAMKVLDTSASVLLARRRLGIARAQQETLEKIKSSVHQGVRSGEMTLVDEQAISAELANASSEYSQATEQIETATSALGIVLGRPGIPEILSYDEPTVARARLTSARALEDNDPRVKAAQQAVRTAEEGSGRDLLREIRCDHSSLAILITTAQDQVSDRIAGLSDGADDYIVKPYDLDELVARIEAVARRYVALPDNVVTIGHIEIDLSRRQLRRDGQDVDLSAREWAIVELLARRPGALCSREQIEDALYGLSDDVESNAIEVFISRIRKKTEAGLIVTVRGRGYSLAGTASR